MSDVINRRHHVLSRLQKKIGHTVVSFCVCGLHQTIQSRPLQSTLFQVDSHWDQPLSTNHSDLMELNRRQSGLCIFLFCFFIPGNVAAFDHSQWLDLWTQAHILPCHSESPRPLPWNCQRVLSLVLDVL